MNRTPGDDAAGLLALLAARLHRVTRTRRPPTRDVASVDRTWSRRGPIEQLEVTTVFGFTMLRDIAR
jgi:hypothetical protein